MHILAKIIDAVVCLEKQGFFKKDYGELQLSAYGKKMARKILDADALMCQART